MEKDSGSGAADVGVVGFGVELRDFGSANEGVIDEDDDGRVRRRNLCVCEVGLGGRVPVLGLGGGLVVGMCRTKSSPGTFSVKWRTWPETVLRFLRQARATRSARSRRLTRRRAPECSMARGAVRWRMQSVARREAGIAGAWWVARRRREFERDWAWRRGRRSVVVGAVGENEVSGRYGMWMETYLRE